MWSKYKSEDGSFIGVREFLCDFAQGLIFGLCLLFGGFVLGLGFFLAGSFLGSR